MRLEWHDFVSKFTEDKRGGGGGDGSDSDDDQYVAPSVSHDTIRFSDIPWPPEDLGNTLKVALSHYPAALAKSTWKDVMLRWHPDKFQQSFGKRLLFYKLWRRKIAACNGVCISFLPNFI